MRDPKKVSAKTTTYQLTRDQLLCRAIAANAANDTANRKRAGAA
jgi:hypothetical protein